MKTPISNVSSRYMPADDGGGVGPYLNLFRPSDDSTGGGDPRSAGQLTAAKLNVKAVSSYAAVLR